MSLNSIRLIVKRFLGQLGLRLLAWYIAPVIIVVILILTLRVLSKYDCPIRSLIAYPDVKEHPPFASWEHDCEAWFGRK